MCDARIIDRNTNFVGHCQKAWKKQLGPYKYCTRHYRKALQKRTDDLEAAHEIRNQLLEQQGIIDWISSDDWEGAEY